MSDIDQSPANDALPDKPATKVQGDKKAHKRKPGNNASAKRGGAQIDHSAPLHQARVFAMQALFEDDITNHGLDEILQHVGVDRRRELVSFYSGIQADALKIIDAIAFLAQHADLNVPDTVMSNFREGSLKAVRGLTESDEPADRDLTDTYLSIVRGRVEKQVSRMIGKYRDNAERRLAETLATAQKASASPPSVLAWDEDDDDAPGDKVLTDLEATIKRAMDETLAADERQSIAVLVDILRHSETIARGVQQHRDEIDPYIIKAAPAFPIPQLASIDRAVLRIAIYELLHEPGVPFKAAINEAVEISKRFGGPNSGRFVNGVLRTISESLPDTRKEAPAKA